MRRQTRTPWLAGLVLGLVAGLAQVAPAAAAANPPAARPAAAARPNILWIVSEDNDPFLGCYGDAFANTPRLDRLAAEGVLYLKAFANAPVCAPCRSTMITGMYASSLGTQNMRSRYAIPPDVRYYPQYLREAGYYCMNPGKTDYNIAGNDKAAWDKGGDWSDAPAGKPWMLVLNNMTTHESCLHGSTVHPEYLKESFTLPPYHPDTPELRSNWVEYYHKVTKMDGEMGAILDRLDKDKLTDDTIVFYYGDHGGILPRSKRFCYDSGLHAPLIVRFGKNVQHLAPAPPGSKLDRIVSFIDFPVTVLSLAGAAIPEHMQGQAFAGPRAATPREYAFGFRNRMDERYDFVRTVRDARFRYIRNYMPHRILGQHIAYLWQMPATASWERAFKAGKCNDLQSAFWREKPIEELYDEQADPYEVTNLAERPEHRETIERLRAALRAHLLATRDTGFLAESEMTRRANGGPIRTMAVDDARYPMERIMAAAELASRRDAGDVPKLIELMADPDPAVRYWAAVGCCVRKGQASAAVEPLGKLLTDAEPTVRIAAAEALGWQGKADRGVPILADALALPGEFDVLLALNALDNLGDVAKPFADTIAPKVPKGGGEYVGRASEWLLVKLGKSPEAPAEDGTKKPAKRKAAKATE